MNNSAAKVGEIFREAGTAFMKLSEMTMSLHSMDDSTPGEKWTDGEVELLRGCVNRFAVDLNKLSHHIKNRTMTSPNQRRLDVEGNEPPPISSAPSSPTSSTPDPQRPHLMVTENRDSENELNPENSPPPQPPLLPDEIMQPAHLEQLEEPEQPSFDFDISPQEDFDIDLINTSYPLIPTEQYRPESHLSSFLPVPPPIQTTTQFAPIHCKRTSTVTSTMNTSTYHILRVPNYSWDRSHRRLYTHYVNERIPRYNDSILDEPQMSGHSSFYETEEENSYVRPIRIQEITGRNSPHYAEELTAALLQNRAHRTRPIHENLYLYNSVPAHDPPTYHMLMPATSTVSSRRANLEPEQRRSPTRNEMLDLFTSFHANTSTGEADSRRAEENSDEINSLRAEENINQVSRTEESVNYFSSRYAQDNVDQYNSLRADESVSPLNLSTVNATPETTSDPMSSLSITTISTVSGCTVTEERTEHASSLLVENIHDHFGGIERGYYRPRRGNVDNDRAIRYQETTDNFNAHWSQQTTGHFDAIRSEEDTGHFSTFRSPEPVDRSPESAARLSSFHSHESATQLNSFRSPESARHFSLFRSTEPSSHVSSFRSTESTSQFTSLCTQDLSGRSSSVSADKPNNNIKSHRKRNRSSSARLLSVKDLFNHIRSCSPARHNQKNESNETMSRPQKRRLPSESGDVLAKRKYCSRPKKRATATRTRIESLTEFAFQPSFKYTPDVLATNISEIEATTSIHNASKKKKSDTNNSNNDTSDKNTQSQDQNKNFD